MKIIIIYLLFMLSLNGGEIQRMESIVTDIKVLRAQIKELEDKFEKTNKLLENAKKALKVKEKVIKSLQKKKVYIKPKEIIKFKKCKVVADKPNGFPRLILKDKFNR